MPYTDSIRDIDAKFRSGLRVRLGWLCIVLLSAIAAYRFGEGQRTVAWIDVAWAATLLLTIGWIRWVGNSTHVGTFMAAISISASLFKIQFLHTSGVPWLFPIVLGTFAVAARVPAAIISGAGVLYASYAVSTFEDVETASTIGISLWMTLLVALVGVTHVEKLRMRLGRLATRDALTGAGNRGALAGALDALLHSPAGRGDAAIALLDIDHFKRVNDRHGHSAGDRVLVQLTALAQRLMRPDDRFFRFGGEEFVLLMPSIAHADASALAARVGAAVRQELSTADGPITVSAGLTMLRVGDTVDSALARADRALYAAKAAGRDRVVDHSFEPVPA